MKAAVLYGVGQPFQIEEVELATPLEREVIVDIKASGLCHSDLHIQEQGFGFEFPSILGHEVAGVVSQVGSEVTEFEVGDHVVACLTPACGVCNACVDGRRHQCERPDLVRRTADQPSRITLNGQPVTQFSEISGFAEQILVHANQIVRINKDIPFSRAALLGCGVVTGAGAVLNTAKVGVGDDVAIIGCGGVGLNAVQGARLAGARRIIAIDLQPGKLELAKQFGATHTINPSEVEDVPAAVREITGTSGVNAAFEIIGLRSTAEMAVHVTGVGGCAYFVGMIKPGERLDIDPFGDLLMQQRGVRGVYMGSTNFKLDIPMLADFYVQGRLNLDDLVSQTISLEEINRGYEDLKKGGVARTVITFD